MISYFLVKILNFVKFNPKIQKQRNRSVTNEGSKISIENSNKPTNY